VTHACKEWLFASLVNQTCKWPGEWIQEKLCRSLGQSSYHLRYFVRLRRLKRNISRQHIRMYAGHVRYSLSDKIERSLTRR
jgi:hypothetical protein